MIPKHTAKDLMDKLRHKYGGNTYIIIEQVARGTGSYADSYIDGVVMSLWPSRGVTRAAFEIKVDRQDFLHEMFMPHKNEWVRNVFHEFWYIAPKGVIKSADEVPEGRGWMKPHGKGLSVVKYAQRKKDPPLPDPLLASLMRNIIKEKDRELNEHKKILMEEDYDIKNALNVVNNVEKYLKTRGITWHGRPEGIVNKLQRLTDDHKLIKKHARDKKRVINILETYQDRILDMFEMFAALGFIGIFEKDEALDNILSEYGDQPVMRVKELVNKKYKKNDRWSKEKDTRKYELFKMMELVIQSKAQNPKTDVGFGEKEEQGLTTENTENTEGEIND